MTSPPRVDLDELDHTGTLRRLDDDQAAALTSTGLVALRPEGGGVWRITPCGKVGAVRVDGLDVQVRPKTGIARLLFLLGYAADPGFRPEDVDGVAEPDLWPALGHALARQVHRALAPGVLQGYTSIDASLPLVRGRIRIADQVARHPGALLPVEVRFDEYAADIPENQVIRTALRRMAAVPQLSKSVRSQLVHLDGRLDGVAVIPASTAPPAYRITRLNDRYTPALRLAQLVLRHQSAESGPGGVTIAAFVVTMAKVFEDFVATALREALSARPGHTCPQYPAQLDTEGSIPIRPDVVHVEGGRPVAVFDAKYKLEDPTAGYPNVDNYQMLAYCTALGLSTGWLVYAHGTSSPGRRRVRNTAIDLASYPLDLSATPTEILDSIDALASAALGTADPPG